ncbi:hypothetical protein [Pseudoalteromonas tetraodonis]|uniref:hypothetical protein n=1 Tax=Pseudoalteromonas tetraodonis TaxID=43659 RepID=UPI000849BC4D|nr:hypothetical protein [Pseudoalteromonas tetraodonis]MBT2151724.1 hypothetical protein [Pseudoalteromonas tetraodonis]ODS14610.1 hypothetical protein BCD66_09675 [Pseudoalteromonas tetraodonis]
MFGYCYQSAISLLQKMAIDAYPDNALMMTFLYGIGFNLLSGHLITKYDHFWPVWGAFYIGIIGLVAVPLLLNGVVGLLPMSLLVGILLSLPVSTFAIGLIKEKLNKN